MSLTAYQRKRNFAATPEPAEGGATGHGIFVVQLHHASHRHYDFRLELDGVLKSWAVPKGPSFDPKIKRLAMEVEDHPISYATFEGDIPKGNYGAGHVDVFDHGTWEPVGDAKHALAQGELKFHLHGDILRGSWVLIRTRKQGSKQQWLLIKHHDGYASERDADSFVDPTTDRPLSLAQRKKVWPRSPGLKKASAEKISVTHSIHAALKTVLRYANAEKLTPQPFAPELCRLQPSPPSGEDWLHEIKWDGYRILTTVVKGNVQLWSRNALEWTDRLPELVEAIESLQLKSAQLDGEMIVMRDERDDFNALQGRLSAETQTPATYMLFDLPHLEGKSLRDIPLVQRKALLAEVLTKHPHPLLRYSEHQLGEGKMIFAQAIAAGREGIVSKRVDSGYSGSRNGDWVKVKGRPSDEFAVVGYTLPKGSRTGIGALLLGQPRRGQMTYVGRAGTGLSSETLREWRQRLAPFETDEPTVDTRLMSAADRRLAIWVKPTFVIEAYYQGIGGKGLLRQPAFKALRSDKEITDLADKEQSSKSENVSDIHPTAKQKSNVSKQSRTMERTAKAKAPKPSQSGDAKTKIKTKDVLLTHPERIVFAEAGKTKGDVADYYRAVSAWLLPEIAGRPLSVLRCPDGTGKACFFQKHLGRGWGEHVQGIEVEEKEGREQYLSVEDQAGVLELVQMNVLEFHPWGATAADLEHADRLVFDLDPHASVAWKHVTAAARDLREQLASIGLDSFLRTSGGKGLHVVVPLNPPAPWEAVKAFAQAVAEAMTTLKPKEFVSVAGETHRKGKIFIDWLRNGRGATSVASYSLRARPKAGVAMPLAWDELKRVQGGDAFTIKNALKWIQQRKADPWKGIAKVKQALPKLNSHG